MDKIPDIVKTIEGNVKVNRTDRGKISYQSVGGKRYLQFNTPVGLREFRNMEMIKGASLLITILSESSKEFDRLLHGKIKKREVYPDLTESGKKRKKK